jgi:7,8-dihydropterin-6-yl-methyl-4-(beta-D-ribofuranosyl)aminobenzene 5'-phosphate synthase
MKITVIYDNCLVKTGLEASWGFSALIETENEPPILFDTGANGAILLHNMKRLGIDPTRIGTIVISHHHYDHTGGMADVLEINNHVVIYAPASISLRLPGENVIQVSQPVQISDAIFSTGELRGIEQALAINISKGIVVVTGCSHPGVGEILDVASCYGKIYGIIGGFHGFHDFSLKHYPVRRSALASTGNAVEDLFSITAVHPMKEDAVAEFLENAGADWGIIQELIDSGNLIGLDYQGKKFYMPKLPGVVSRDSCRLSQNN